ncbi:maleylpyruvate isomerase family mycothiol-dependent enzyme [Streptomyces sp. SAJ15]|uniref:maleylpyruvate isomerase family mycothiol-dependent enzyme n=1 Tax=Streptomyces sp. SAJ15 TaxID=2011095 RepID=UPI00118537B0|nr:maleylpyruvate isomerase family mycothiol-dependent enzyme [Streptomyces sp. SAJ15]TVL89994.1 hypothetical protein CD790_24720 [Streptomyces sp. SAJ15]
MTDQGVHRFDRLDHDRCCTEIIAQTDLLRAAVTGADPSVTCPTCPDWSIADLLRHVGSAHRWAEAIVRTRATAYLPPDQVPDDAPRGDDLAALDAWLAKGATALAETLRAAGAKIPVWTWAEDQTVGFWARRMAHETVVHRADGAIAAGAEYTVAPEVAADAVDEWLDVLRQPNLRAVFPGLAKLRGPGRSLHLHATDTAPEAEAEWLIELDEEGFAWRRAHGKASVALRAPMTDLLLAFYRRLPVDGDRVEVLGDAAVLDFWLEHATFG